jgi:2-polyprenyl-3-methyl-5-hydroxy-6-metoxy-1,4-benzoquinol methylase
MSRAREEMGEFWDERARENSLYFINNSLTYKGTDEERFWASGVSDLDAVLGALGVAIDPRDEIVEIGCGIGRMSRPMAARGRSVRAIDVSAEMLAQARRANREIENITWIQGTGDSLTAIEDESADVCFSYVVLQHIPDPEVILGYIREMGRVLRPGGWAAFQVSNDENVHRPRRSLGTRVRTLLGRAPGGQRHGAWLGCAVSVEDVRKAAADGGMEVERTSGEGSQFCIVLARKAARE